MTSMDLDDIYSRIGEWGKHQKYLCFLIFLGQMNLICDQAYKAGFSQSIFMCGIFVGALVFGVVSDAIGRIKTIYITVTIMIVASSILGFVSTFNQFVLFRFVVGFGMAGFGLASYVLGSELIGGSKRGFFAVCFSSFFAFGICFLVALALMVSNWRHLSHCVSLVTLAIALLYLRLPESPRWLISQGKSGEAIKVIEAIARGNGMHDVPGGYELKLPPEVISEQSSASPSSEGISVIFKNLTAFLWTTIMAYSWFANSAVYYGLTMAAGNLSRNIYASVLLSGAAELPAYLFVNMVHQRMGRRTLIASTMITGGFGCMWILLVGSEKDSSNYRTALALVGKMGISASFTAIYVHTAEVFPTVMRNAGLGICSMAARVGGVVAPAILVVGSFYPAREFLIFGLIAFTSGLLNLRLPETFGKPLPETVADMLNLDITNIVRMGTKRNPELQQSVI